MPIAPADVKWYRSKSVSESGSNGGRISAVEAVSNIKNNIFPDVTQAERTAGSLKFRKMFIKFANASNLAASNVRLFVENPTPGGDSLTIFPGTQEDVQSAIVTPRLYGCGQLNADASVGATSIQVLTEDVALNIFRNGDSIRISDKTSITAGTGNEEYGVINGVPSYSGNIATIALTTPLLSAYVAAATRVASVYTAGAVAASCTAPVVTSAAGTYNNAGRPVILNSIGTVEENITLTFTDPTHFAASGDLLGSLGVGTVGVDFSPNNPDFGVPYFTVPTLAWGGAFLVGDTVTFGISPAAVPIWYRRNVPASTGPQSGNVATIAVDFESA